MLFMVYIILFIYVLFAYHLERAPLVVPFLFILPFACYGLRILLYRVAKGTWPRVKSKRRWHKAFLRLKTKTALLLYENMRYLFLVK